MNDVGSQMFQAYVAKNFITSTANLKTDKVKFENFAEKIQSLYNKNTGYELEKTHIDFDSSTKLIMFICKDNTGKEVFLISAQTDNGKIYFVTIFADSFKNNETIFNTFKPYYISDEDYVIKMYSYYETKGAVSYEVFTNTLSDFENTHEYYYPYLDVQELYSQYLLSDSNLILLVGEQGIGKTKFINLGLKYMLNNIDTLTSLRKEFYDDNNPDEDDDEQYKEIRVAYIKNTNLLTMDELWNDLAKKRFALVILDDLDYILTTREAKVESHEDVIRNKFINQFTSFADGIFKQGNSTKFIITTNQPTDSMDKAILREGRTFDVLKFRLLSNKEALDIWIKTGFDKKDFETHFKGKEKISSAELGGKISMITRANKNKTVIKHSYVKEAGISLHREVKAENKRTGFIRD
jgi:hypothetical protein